MMWRPGTRVCDTSKIVDQSSPEKIRAAIDKINRTRGLRDKLGMAVFNQLLNASSYTVALSDLAEESNKTIQGLNLHFGWFCKCVAKELGYKEPAKFALADQWMAGDGKRMLTLKHSVVIAMRG